MAQAAVTTTRGPRVQTMPECSEATTSDSRAAISVSSGCPGLIDYRSLIGVENTPVATLPTTWLDMAVEAGDVGPSARASTESFDGIFRLTVVIWSAFALSSWLAESTCC